MAEGSSFTPMTSRAGAWEKMRYCSWICSSRLRWLAYNWGSFLLLRAVHFRWLNPIAPQPRQVPYVSLKFDKHGKFDKEPQSICRSASKSPEQNKSCGGIMCIYILCSCKCKNMCTYRDIHTVEKYVYIYIYIFIYTTNMYDYLHAAMLYLIHRNCLAVAHSRSSQYRSTAILEQIEDDS